MENEQHYVAQKVGDRYVMVPQKASGVFSGQMIGGALLALIGLKRGGLLGTIALLAGGATVYQSLTGENLLANLMKGSGSQFEQNRGPSFQHDQRAGAQQKPTDEVEEASMESFPASDAPAHTSSTGA